MSDGFSFSITPELTHEAKNKLGFKLESVTASYTHDGETRELILDSDNSLAFEDTYGIWSVEEYGIDLQYSVSFQNPSVLFSDIGIGSKDDVLGIAIRIMSPKSRQRIILKNTIRHIHYSSEKIIFDILASIPAGRFRDSAVSELFVFMVKPSVESSFIRPGTVLGILRSDVLSFSGDSSDFPIETISVNSNHLWKLYIDCDDPHTDMFNQCVSLTLNEKHPRYKDLKINDDPLSDMVFREIMSQAMYLIISKVQKSEYYEDVISNNNLEPGSVGQAVYYMLCNLQSDGSDPLMLSEELHDLVIRRSEGSDE